MSRDITIVGRRGLEPRTYGLKVRSSTIELATPGLVVIWIEIQSKHHQVAAPRVSVSGSERKGAHLLIRTTPRSFPIRIQIAVGLSIANSLERIRISGVPMPRRVR